jgi:rRNA maturation endonuclease Nob1
MTYFGVSKAQRERALKVRAQARVRLAAVRAAAGRLGAAATNTETGICEDCGGEFTRKKTVGQRQPKSRCALCEAARKSELKAAARLHAAERNEARKAAGTRSTIFPCRGCGRFLPEGAACPRCGDTNRARVA